jgi:hypothetical protein
LCRPTHEVLDPAKLSCILVLHEEGDENGGMERSMRTAPESELMGSFLSIGAPSDFRTRLFSQSSSCNLGKTRRDELLRQSSHAGRHDAGAFYHQDDRALGCARPMFHAFQDDESFSRRQIDRTIFQIDQEPATNHIEEFIFVVVVMPVIFTLDHAQPDNAFVHPAECLVIPLILAGLDQPGHIDLFQRPVQNVEPRVVRKVRRRSIAITHGD